MERKIIKEWTIECPICGNDIIVIAYEDGEIDYIYVYCQHDAIASQEQCN